MSSEPEAAAAGAAEGGAGAAAAAGGAQTAAGGGAAARGGRESARAGAPEERARAARQTAGKPAEEEHQHRRPGRERSHLRQHRYRPGSSDLRRTGAGERHVAESGRDKSGIPGEAGQPGQQTEETGER